MWMRCGRPPTPNSWRVSSRGWAPRWFWPSFAAPATLYLLVFFVFPFYVVLAVTFGTTDQILRQPVPYWNPMDWNPSVLQFTVSNLTHTDGLYHAAFIHTIVFVGIATILCLLIGYPVAYFLARHSGRYKGLFLVAFFAPFWIVHAADAGLGLAPAGRRVREQGA